MCVAFTHTHRKSLHVGLSVMLALGGADIGRWRVAGRNLSRKWVVKSPLGHCWLTGDRWDEGESGTFLWLTNILRHASEIELLADLLRYIRRNITNAL